MKHRNLLPGFETSTAAVADILERGNLQDWRVLAQAVREDPWGPTAQAVDRVLSLGPHMYGTSILWREYLGWVRGAARPAPG